MRLGLNNIIKPSLKEFKKTTAGLLEIALVNVHFVAMVDRLEGSAPISSGIEKVCVG